MMDFQHLNKLLPNKLLQRPKFSHLYYALILWLFATTQVACSKRYHDLPSFSPFNLGDYENKSVGRFKTTYLVDQIDEYYRGTDPGPIGVTSFVNLDDLESTSAFGRVYAEQVLSELSMRGYDVIELRKASALSFVDESGEFLLSRSSPMLSRAHHLGSVVVGTYSVSPERVFVNARLIDPSSAVVLAASSIELSKTREIAKMLRGGNRPAVFERVPTTVSRLVNVPLTYDPSGNLPTAGTQVPRVQPILPGLSTKPLARP